MLYSEKELEKRLKAGCALYYFYASDEALVHTAAQKTLKYLNRDDPETTVLDGPTPSVEEIVLAAGTISFFGGKRLVLMPLIRRQPIPTRICRSFATRWPTPRTPSLC